MILGMNNALGTDKGIAYLALSPIVGDTLMLALLIFVLKESPKYVMLFWRKLTLRLFKTPPVNAQRRKDRHRKHSILSRRRL